MDLFEEVSMYKNFGVTDNNIKVIDGNVCINKLGIIQFTVGQIVNSENIDSMPESLRITTLNLYDFLNSTCDGSTFLSGEFEGLTIDKSSFNCGELIDLLYSIYSDRTVVMGKHHDVKDSLLVFKMMFNKG